MKKPKLKPNTYEILSLAVEYGLEYGYRRAHKHTDNPSEELIKEEMQRAIMNEVCEVFEL